MRLCAAGDPLPVQQRAVVGTVGAAEVVVRPRRRRGRRTRAAWLSDTDWSGRRAVTDQVLAEGIGLGGADEAAGAGLSRWGRRGCGVVGLAPAASPGGVKQLEVWRT